MKKLSLFLTAMAVMQMAYSQRIISAEIIKIGDFLNTGVGGELSLNVEVSSDVGVYIGCSCYDNNGRRFDLAPVWVIGSDSKTFRLDNDIERCTVRLWERMCSSGTGPDPYNEWGYKNGYYMWGPIGNNVTAYH